MLSSLPPLGPRDAHSLFYPSQSTFHPNHQQTTYPSNSPHPFARPHGHHHQPRTLLSILRADEHAIIQRKANICRFGAGWLRPPGIPKTLQGMADERAEREEQESAANREFALAEAQAAAEAEALEREQEGMTTGEGEQGMERDLDDDVPDADEEDDGGEDWIDDEQEMDEEGMLPRMEDEGDGDYAEAGRDLDEDVPEAGSYQHTDTDLEDESSEDDEMPPATFREVGNTGGGVLGASVFGSSPTVRVRGGRTSDSGGYRREN